MNAYIRILLFCTLGILFIVTVAFPQDVHLNPEWWFGGSLGINYNLFSGTTNTLSPAVTFPAPFTKGSGVGLFVAPMLEYRPDPVWGGMLAVGFDSRRGSFDDVTSAGKTQSLSTTLNYLTIEPSLRITPFESGLYLFAGPRLGFNLSKSVTYTVTGAPATDAEWSDIRGTVVSGQVGVGYDISLTDPDSKTQTELSPFVSLHAGQGPRSVEDWKLMTVRGGVSLIFGTTTELHKKVEKEISFSLRAPKIIPSERKVKETFPMRNGIFFDGGTPEIPQRYIQLSADDAKSFTEAKLLQPQPQDLTGRSRRQLTVYHNILNVLGDRLRKYSTATVTLTGSSIQGEAQGQAYAEAVKKYLVDIYGIQGSRIVVEGRTKPEHPSWQPGGTRELDLVKAEDQRVDISSNNPELLAPVQIISLQEEPLDSDVLFNVSGAQDILASWSLEVTDASGGVKKYGPFTSEEERISGKEILGDQHEGKYTVALVGETKGGQSVRKEQVLRLAKSDTPEDSLGLRFSILFEFDESKTIATYENFLTKTVAPLIPDGGSVIIHGHTDIVGEESHNLKLSQDRAHDAMSVIDRALRALGKNRVKFDAYGFGEDARRAPFDNKTPEERFYNRTVIIDIVPEQ